MSIYFKESILEWTIHLKLRFLVQMGRYVKIIQTSSSLFSGTFTPFSITNFIILQGKTTLLNLIMGHCRPVAGSITINSGLRIGHFTQHHSERFDLSLSAIENMLNLFNSAEDQVMRSFLGRFQIQGVDALKPMRYLSGGKGEFLHHSQFLPLLDQLICLFTLMVKK